MAATKSTLRLLTARPCLTRPAAVATCTKPVYGLRLQSTSPQDVVRKANAATADMSSANAGSVSDTIKHDHAELKEFYNNILNAKDNDSKIRWQNQFTWELARHSIGEELVVYPAMEREMGEEGKQLAQKDRQEHNEVRLCANHFLKALTLVRSRIRATLTNECLIR
jgi:hypothetical protein